MMRGVPRLLVVHHSPTASMRRLTEAVLAGAHDDEVQASGPVEVVALEALAFARGEADHDDLLAADGYVLGTTANFGYMSGALKHVFDSTFLHVGGALGDTGAPAPGSGTGAGATARRPYGLYLHGRHDLTGAVRSVEAVVGALGWRRAHADVGILGEVGPAESATAYGLGGTIAALLAG